MPTTFTTKFSLGDTVWPINTQPVQRKVRCFTCTHTGKVTINNEEFDCPACKGACLRQEHVGWMHFVCESTRIGKIEVSSQEPDWNYSAEHIARESQPRYMLRSTGVGSGTVWKESELFLSKEEAQAECDRRNASVKQEDDTL